MFYFVFGFSPRQSPHVVLRPLFSCLPRHHSIHKALDPAYAYSSVELLKHLQPFSTFSSLPTVHWHRLPHQCLSPGGSRL